MICFIIEHVWERYKNVWAMFKQTKQNFVVSITAMQKDFPLIKYQEERSEI